MSRKAMDELQQGQKLLREEVHHLKSHKGLVMEALQVLLKEGNLPPIAALEMVNRLHQPILPQSHLIQNQKHNQNQRNMAPFGVIHISYNQLYLPLIHNSLVTPRSLDPLTSPYPPWYNPSATSEYHEGTVGHCLDTCMVLKDEVQDLTNKKMLTFKEEMTNVKSNPLPGQSGPTINDVGENLIHLVIREVEELKTPLATFHERLVELGMIRQNHDGYFVCNTHQERCMTVKNDIQKFMDQSILQISCAKSE